MKQWLSKFRSRRLKDRFGDGVTSVTTDEVAWWNQPLYSVLIGFLLWSAACILLHTGIAGKRGNLDATLAMAGKEILILIFTGVAGMLLRVLSPKLLKANSRLLLLALCALATVIPGAALLNDTERWASLPPAVAGMLIPFALAPLLSGVLLGGAAATVAGLWATLTCLVISNFSIPVLIAGLIATTTAARLVHTLRRPASSSAISAFPCSSRD